MKLLRKFFDNQKPLFQKGGKFEKGYYLFEALEAFRYCCKLEGIIPALEPAHALAVLKKIAPDMNSDEIVVMNMCGRGDKDIYTVAKALDINI